MRGEYCVLTTIVTPPRESPPHTWGIQIFLDREISASRFTPTCVGNIAAGINMTQLEKDHPHLRGEYMSAGTSKKTLLS